MINDQRSKLKYLIKPLNVVFMVVLIRICYRIKYALNFIQANLLAINAILNCKPLFQPPNLRMWDSVASGKHTVNDMNLSQGPCEIVACFLYVLVTSQKMSLFSIFYVFSNFNSFHTFYLTKNVFLTNLSFKK